MPLLARALTMLLVLVGVLTVTGTTAQAATPGPGTFSGTLSTADGKPITTLVKVSLYTFTSEAERDRGPIPTSQSSVLLAPGSDMHYVFTAPSAGYYAILAQPTGVGAQHLATWFGSGESIADDYGDPGVLFMGEDLTPQTGKDIALRPAVTLSGTVRGSDHQPVADATVVVQQWSDTTPSHLEPVPGVRGSITTAAGTYSLPIPPGTKVSVSVPGRIGYEPSAIGDGSVADAIVVDRDTTRDITLVPDWSAFGGNDAVQPDEYCLQHAGSGTATVAAKKLDVRTQGVITLPDGDWPGATPLSGPVPALVPYWSDTPRNLTWGVSGSTLCAVWTKDTDSMAYQAIYDADDGQVTYNYASIGRNLYNATPEAGWTNSDETVRFPEDDGATLRDLPVLSKDSDVPGRFSFHYEFISRPPPTRLPRFTSTAVVGQPLTVDPGTWAIPAGSTPVFRYTWLRDGLELPTAGTSSYVPRRADVGHALSVVVTLLAGPGYDEGFDEQVDAPAVARATSSVELTGKHRVRKGKRARVGVAVRMPGLVPEGSVLITDNGVPLTSAPLDSDARATIRLPRLKRGVHHLQATYVGDGTTQSSVSSVVRLRVVRR